MHSTHHTIKKTSTMNNGEEDVNADSQFSLNIQGLFWYFEKLGAKCRMSRLRNVLLVISSLPGSRDHTFAQPFVLGHTPHEKEQHFEGHESPEWPSKELKTSDPYKDTSRSRNNQ